MGIKVTRSRKSEEGKVMVLALVLLVVGTLLLTPLLGLMSTGLIAGRVYENKTDELYAADAGVMDVIWKIQTGIITAPQCGDDQANWAYNITDLINDKGVSINVSYVDDQTFRIVSEAHGDSGSGTIIESYVFYGNDWGRLLDFGVVALDGNIYIEQNTVLDSYPDRFACHIYAQGKDLDDPDKGNIFIVDNSKLYGMATATGKITIGSKATLSPGPPFDGLRPPLEFSLPDIDRYLGEAQAGGIWDDDMDIQSDQPLGPLHITGDLNISGNAVVTLGGPVWVDGEVKATGTALIVGKGPLVAVNKIEIAGTEDSFQDEMPVLISTQNTIAATGTGTVYAVLYAPNAMIAITGTAEISGAIIAKSVRIRTAGKNQVRYDVTVVERVRVPALRIHTWEIS